MTCQVLRMTSSAGSRVPDREILIDPSHVLHTRFGLCTGPCHPEFVMTAQGVPKAGTVRPQLGGSPSAKTKSPTGDLVDPLALMTVRNKPLRRFSQTWITVN